MKKLIVAAVMALSAISSVPAIASKSASQNFCTASRDYAVAVVEARASGVTQEIAEGFATAKNAEVKQVQNAIIIMAYAVPAAEGNQEWKKLAHDVGEMNYQMCIKAGVVK